ncbi:MAG TPA: sigma 54-interacting transcriptional regulator [Polyangiaceae bacterium]|jgi:transcriptional regulator with GAF, ATPase, and Fis domain
MSDKLAEPRTAAAWEALERVGEGATSVVWRARRADGGQLAALKLAREDEASVHAVAREATLLARIGRRWGPALVDAGAGFLATDWVAGSPVDPRAIPARTDRERLAVVVAHGVGRALEELHEAGVRHGDVKPHNVLRSSHKPSRDAAEDRGATLIDLGLAADVGAEVLGGTPRYAAPELRERGEAGPAADLWALGLVLAEILEPAVADAGDPAAAVAGWSAKGEPARWVEALLARAPGGRPGARWLASRAARWLELRVDEREASSGRVERVRRTYLAARADDLGHASVGRALAEPARGWLEGALGWARKLAPQNLAADTTLEPMGPVRRARWLVSLAGPSAAAWMTGGDARGEGELVAHAVALARDRDPSAWTLEDLLGQGGASRRTWDPGRDEERVVRLAGELARPAPDPAALELAEDELARGRMPAAMAFPLAAALSRAGETGRAWAALATSSGPEADALRGELARKRGQTAESEAMARRALAATEPADAATRGAALATLARLAWDAGDLDGAERRLEGARGPAAAEVSALVAWRRGTFEPALRGLEVALAEPLDPDVIARLENVRGLLELSRGASTAALRSFGRAVELAARAGAVLEEATYLTSEAAAATDAGELARALASATRAALLWERLGRPDRAARAWLARAGSLSSIGMAHGADEAAEEARARALASHDEQAAAYARWAQVEVRPPGDPRARAWALEADHRLALGTAEDRARSAARLLVWAPDALGDARIAAIDAAAPALPAPARWEWWGARAAAILVGRRTDGDAGVLGALLSLADVPAPLGSRGPALDAAVRLATERGDGDSARRLEHARQLAARALRDQVPPEHAASLASVPWARTSAVDAADVTFAPAQVAQLEAIVRALSGRDRLRPLLEQVLDTMVLWTGVERGLLLLRAPDGRLVPRAARNLARRDLTGDQLKLSQTIAHRAMEGGDAVVATDAFSSLGDVHASVHALKLRSVLAVPLVARGETLGVVYLDDRVRKGAFGPRELAWVRVVASQAAMAIADARDAVLLRRAARRAERARGRLEVALRERDAQLDVTRTQLEIARDGREMRFRYDEIAGRSEPMRELLHLVDRVTSSEVPVLVVGESGTGKELVARAMHANGPRGARAFVSENCASVPETLLESTLFGHVRGAFTGASSTRAGLFDVADGGTLFLDEIGEMSLAMQAKLLRVLQDGEVRPVGGERSRKVDVRVIGATHRDLDAMVAAGKFREDLFYRLNVITLHVPPLRDRPEDVPLLVQHFVKKHAPERAVKVTRAAMAKLATFPWPGNVRQLENELRRALVLGDGAIDVAELSPDVVRGGPSAARGAGLDMRTRVDALESELVVEALQKTRGNQTRAAQLLGLSRFGLQKMMKRLKIKTPSV